MLLTAREQERLMIFTAAELARRRLREGIPLSYPDVVALACDVALERARAGATYEEVCRSVHGLVRADALVEGVEALVAEPHEVEAGFGDGTRIVPLERLVA
jgi:urease gamma subunit